MYPVVLFMTLASMVLLFRAVERGTWARWPLYAVVTGLSFYSHYFALLMPPVHLVYLLIHRAGRRQVLTWVGSMAGAFVVFAPWIVALYTLRIQVSGVRLAHQRDPSADDGLHDLRGRLLDARVLTVYIAGYHSAGLLAIDLGLRRRAVAAGRARGRGEPRLCVDPLPRRGVPRWRGWADRRAVFLVNIAKPGLFFQKYLIRASPAILIALGALAARVLRGRRVVAVATGHRPRPARGEPEPGAVQPGPRGLPHAAAGSSPRAWSRATSSWRCPSSTARPSSTTWSADVRSCSARRCRPEVTIAVSIPEVGPRGGRRLAVDRDALRARVRREGAVPLHLDRTFLRTERYKLGPDWRSAGTRSPRGGPVRDRVALVTPAFAPRLGGAETYIANLVGAAWGRPAGGGHRRGPARPGPRSPPLAGAGPPGGPGGDQASACSARLAFAPRGSRDLGRSVRTW